MANLGDLGFISNNARFQNRVAIAMGVAAAAVYSETSLVATSAATAAGSKVLTFASVPAWVGVGGGVQDMTTASVIPAGAIIDAVTATTVTLSAAITGTGVVSGDIINFTQHGARAQFATRFTNNNFSLLFCCFSVLGNATISAEANASTQPDYAINDSDIQFAVNSMWNMFAGA